MPNYDMQNDPFMFIPTTSKLDHLRNCYRIADRYRNKGDYSFMYGHEGDQFCRLLSEFLMEMNSAESNGDAGAIERLATDVYNTTQQYYPNFLGLVNNAPGWEEYIVNYVEPDDE